MEKIKKSNSKKKLNIINIGDNNLNNLPINNKNNNYKLNNNIPKSFSKNLEKHNNKNNIKRPNTSKQMSVKNYPNEEMTLKSNETQNKNNNLDKQNKINNNNTNLNPQTLEKEINNLNSIKNILTFLNEQIFLVYKSKKIQSEYLIYSKYLEKFQIEEENLKLNQQLNNMNDIIDIDDYFMQNYENILNIFPKISNIFENLNDFTKNIEYSFDRLFLNGNLVCNNNELQKNINNINNSIGELNEKLDKKKEKIKLILEKYSILFNKINEFKNNFETTKKLLNNYGNEFLGNNIIEINKKLKEKNNLLLNNIIYD